MASPNDSPFSVSWPALVVLLVAVWGLIAARPALQSSRPPDLPAPAGPAAGDAGVPARLWQDPLGAVYGPRPDGAAVPGIPAVVAARPAATPQTEGKPILVLLDVIGPENTPEGAEVRRRERYATLAALATAGYAPTQADRLGYAGLRPAEGAGAPARRELNESNMRIPYEWARPLWADQTDPANPPQFRAVCVLWVNPAADSPTQLGFLAALKRAVAAECRANNVECRFAVTGRAVSSQLASVLQEKVEPAPGGGKPLDGVTLYVTNATAPFVRKRVTPNPDTGLRVEYVIGTDDELADSLIDELLNRGLKLGSEKAPVAIIAEWDTDYGRTMHATFGDIIDKAARRSNPGAAPAAGDGGHVVHVHNYSYLRGLDGKALAGALDVAKAAPPAGGEAAGAKPAADQPGAREGEGESQVDYLRRLVGAMKADHGEFGAVGIVGSDVYDKLLLLKALRPSFPEAVFFTTDLDVRLLQPADYEVTRNLLIASHFGLALKEGLQGKAPPFRSSYDTASYLGTLRALDYAAVRPLSPPDGLPVHRYEVGRGGAYELTLFGAGADPVGALNPRLKPWLTEGQHLWLILGVAALAGVLLYPVSRPWQGFLRAAGRLAARPFRKGGAAPAPDPDAPTRARAAAVGVAAALAAALAALVYAAHVTDGEEPFELFEGVSAWPTVVLRFAAVALGAYYLAHAAGDLRKRNEHIRADFFPGEPEGGAAAEGGGLWRHFRASCRVWGHPAGAEEGAVNVRQLYEEFVADGAFRRRASRCALMVAVNLALFGLLWWLFDHTMLQARGRIAWWADRVARFAAAVSLVVLLMFVVDCTLLSHRFVTCLARRAPRVWPPELLAREAAVRGLPPPPAAGPAEEGAAGQALLVRLIDAVTNVVSRLIYYPFVVLLLLIVAQNRLFDDWHWNLPLALIALFCAGTAVACAVLLQRSATAAPARALDEMDRLLRARVGRRGDADRPRFARVKADIEATRSGAFAGLYQSPIAKAVILPLGGGGGLAALEAVLAYLR